MNKQNLTCVFLQKLTSVDGNVKYVCTAGKDCALYPNCDYKINFTKNFPYKIGLIKELRAERNKYKKLYRKNRLDRKKYQKALENILQIIGDFCKKDIITFPDFKPKQNYEFIMKQFNEPLLKILKECEVLKNE